MDVRGAGVGWVLVSTATGTVGGGGGGWSLGGPGTLGLVY